MYIIIIIIIIIVIIRVRSRESPQRHFRADFWVDVASRRVQQWKLNL